MDKVDEAFLRSFGKSAGPGPVYGRVASDQNVNINQRVTQFLMMLQHLADSDGALEALSPLEFSEFVALALGVCGIVDPVEARELIATVLEGLEKADPASGVSRLRPMPVPRH